MINVKTIVVGLLETNCYLVYKDESEDALLIDPGGDYDKIRKAVNEQNKKVKAVLLTHVHIDHIIETAKFASDGAVVYASKNAKKLLNTSADLSEYFNLKFQPFNIDNELIEGLYNIFGYGVRVLETPGHTSDCVCFAIDDCLFSGDTLFNGSCGNVSFPTGCGKLMIKSLKKLYLLPKDYRLLPGHGFESTLTRERENNTAIYELEYKYGKN